MLFGRSPEMVDPADALPGRSTPMPVPANHHVNGAPLTPPWADGTRTAVFAMGCFWGAERLFWELDGVTSTAVGYTAGHTPNPTYDEVCTGRTGHTEAVLVAFEPAAIDYERLLVTFWEGHDPTQGYRQGNDIGTQYRSGIYTADAEQLAAALASRDRYQRVLTAKGFGEITSDVEPLGDFFYAEEYHQQYLSKHPGGYCNLHLTRLGVACPVGIASVED